MERALPGAGELKKPKVVLAPLSKNRGRMRQQLALFLTGVGVLLLLYVSFQYWQMYAAQKKLALAWQQQDARPVNIVGSDGDALVRLTITKINLDAVIVEGTSRKSLKLGPGHMEDSPLPGNSGNSVIVAHRDTFFRHLDELQDGDEIDLRRQGEVYRFVVTGRRIAEPTDLSALRQSSSVQLTLITCYPTHYVGPAPQRLVVVARLIATSKTAGE
jgi:sortase A